jgi:hypothetical protein
MNAMLEKVPGKPLLNKLRVITKGEQLQAFDD